MFSTWPLLICAALETGLNQLRLQAPKEYARQYQLHNKVIKLQLLQLNFPLYLIFAKQIQVYSQYQGDVNVQVNADITTLYRLSEGSSLTELIKQDKLQLEGDLSTLQAFSHYLQQNPFDFAEFISKYIGDVPTHMLEQQLRQGKTFVEKLLLSTQQHIKELSTEEYKITPNKLEFYVFKDKIEDVSKDIATLESRLTQLQNKVKA